MNYRGWEIQISAGSPGFWFEAYSAKYGIHFTSAGARNLYATRASALRAAKRHINRYEDGVTYQVSRKHPC